MILVCVNLCRAFSTEIIGGGYMGLKPHAVEILSFQDMLRRFCLSGHAVEILSFRTWRGDFVFLGHGLEILSFQDMLRKSCAF